MSKRLAGKTFDKSLAVHQIHQSFLLSNFCTIRYSIGFVFSLMHSACLITSYIRISQLQMPG